MNYLILLIQGQHEWDFDDFYKITVRPHLTKTWPAAIAAQTTLLVHLLD